MAGILIPNAPQAGHTLLSSTTLSGASVVLSSIPASYDDLRIVIRLALPATDAVELQMRFNDDSTANRHFWVTSNTAPGASAFNRTSIRLSPTLDNAVTQSLNIIDIFDYANTTTWKMCQFNSLNNDSTTTTSIWPYLGQGMYNQTSAISSLSFIFSSGNATSGTILLYGVK